MESEIIVRKNMTLTNEKVKNMCRLNYEDNDFLFTTHDGKCVIIDKSKLIIHIERDDDSNIQEYQKYLQNIMRKRKNKIILTTLFIISFFGKSSHLVESRAFCIFVSSKSIFL